MSPTDQDGAFTVASARVSRELRRKAQILKTKGQIPML